MSHAVIRTLFLLLLLDLTNFSYTQQFWRLHIDHPKSDVPGSSNQYCNVMLGWRRVHMVVGCKPVHTFIHENTSSIASLCSRAPVPCGNQHVKNCHQSPNLVKVTDCFAKSGFLPLTCQYLEKSNYRKIKVICMKGRPVFLEN